MINGLSHKHRQNISRNELLLYAAGRRGEPRSRKSDR